MRSDSPIGAYAADVGASDGAIIQPVGGLNAAEIMFASPELADYHWSGPTHPPP